MFIRLCIIIEPEYPVPVVHMILREVDYEVWSRPCLETKIISGYGIALVCIRVGKISRSGCSIPVVRVHGVDVDRVRFSASRL